MCLSPRERYLCLFVCVCVSVCVSTYLSLPVSRDGCKYVSACVCLCLFVCVFKRTSKGSLRCCMCQDIQRHRPAEHIDMHTHTDTHTHTHTYTVSLTLSSIYIYTLTRFIFLHGEHVKLPQKKSHARLERVHSISFARAHSPYTAFQLSHSSAPPPPPPPPFFLPSIPNAPTAGFLDIEFSTKNCAQGKSEAQCLEAGICTDSLHVSSSSM
jgi:hypothetical protein